MSRKQFVNHNLNITHYILKLKATFMTRIFYSMISIPFNDFLVGSVKGLCIMVGRYTRSHARPKTVNSRCSYCVNMQDNNMVQQ